MTAPGYFEARAQRSWGFRILVPIRLCFILISYSISPQPRITQLCSYAPPTQPASPTSFYSVNRHRLSVHRPALPYVSSFFSLLFSPLPHQHPNMFPPPDPNLHPTRRTGHEHGKAQHKISCWHGWSQMTPQWSMMKARERRLRPEILHEVSP